MTAILVGYDLITPGQKYDKVHEKLKAYGTYAHVLDSTWIVCGYGLTAQSVSDNVRSVMDSGDHLFAVDVSNAGRQGWLPETTWDWIRKNV